MISKQGVGDEFLNVVDRVSWVSWLSSSRLLSSFNNAWLISKPNDNWSKLSFELELEWFKIITGGLAISVKPWLLLWRDGGHNP